MIDRDVELVFLDEAYAYKNNGAIKRRIALRLDGEDADALTVRLDSDHARRLQAKKWAADFDLDEDDLHGRLRKAAIIATKDVQNLKQPTKGVRGAKSPPYPPHSIEVARPVFRKWLDLFDSQFLDVVFGVVMAHRLDGDPVWLFVVGAPGDGKTEILRSLSASDDVFSLSTLTSGALISGYITDGPDPSLLPKLDGKILMVKDFTAVLEMPHESRAEVLGILRDAYDGEAAKAFGTGETKSYKSRFGLLAAVTPFIDACWGVSQQLGERFLRFRLPSNDGHRKKKTRRALSNTNDETTMRKELSAAAMGVLAQTPEAPKVPGDIEEQLVALADFVSLARSDVSRDRKGVIQYIPSPEVGTRVGKALKKLAMGVAMARGMGIVTPEEYTIICRVGLDTIPSMRGRLLGVLWELRESFEKTSTIADEAELPTDTANNKLGDLRLLGMVKRGGGQHGGYSWRLDPDFQGTIEQAGIWGEQGSAVGGGDSAPQTDLGVSENENRVSEPSDGSGVQTHPPAPGTPMSSDTPVGVGGDSTPHADSISPPDEPEAAEREVFEV